MVVKGIDLRSPLEGYAYVSVTRDSKLSLAELRAAVKKTPFEFVDLQWVVMKGKEPEK